MVDDDNLIDAADAPDSRDLVFSECSKARAVADG
jgi:hypothetical protein